jgi:hypothetical protein
MSTAAETTIRLLDLLEQYEGGDLIDGGELWSVAEWVAEWSVGAEVGDCGPVVTTLEKGHERRERLSGGSRPLGSLLSDRSASCDCTQNG